MRRALAAAALALAAAAPAAAQADGTAAFDTAWTTIQRTHFDTTFNGVDWAGVRDELRPRAEAARTPDATRAVIREMLGRLHQSHFYLIPAEADPVLSARGAGDGDAGLDLRLVEGALVVTRVRAGGPADACGVRTGWELLQAGSRRSADILDAVQPLEPRLQSLQAWSAARAALSGDVGDSLDLHLEDGDGVARECRLLLDASPGEPTRFGNLPEMRVRAESERVDVRGASIGIIRFNLWLPALAPRLDDAVDRLRSADGIVIDLRGNVGGAGAMAMGIAGHFIDRPDTLGTMRMRHATLRFVVNPRRSTAAGARVTPFAGPMAILTDATTASTSEIFAAGLQRLGRARVFGEPSAGQALPAYMKPLPGGDVLVHAIADFTGPGESRLEGTGVIPDVAAAPTRAALLSGRDNALAAALEWIAGETGH